MLLSNVFELPLWYALPLIISISLVYGATRHEVMVPILKHAVRAAGWVTGFMIVIFFILRFAGWGL